MKRYNGYDADSNVSARYKPFNAIKKTADSELALALANPAVTKETLSRFMGYKEDKLPFPMRESID